VERSRISGAPLRKSSALHRVREKQDGLDLHTKAGGKRHQGPKQEKSNSIALHWEGGEPATNRKLQGVQPHAPNRPDFSVRLSKSGAADRHRPGRAHGSAVLKHKEIVMKYMLLIYGDEAALQTASQETVGQIIAAYGAYTEAMKKAGVHVGSNRLRPTDSGTTVRVANGKTHVLDGPYAETKEQLGGYYMIEVPDLDAALSWAARCPGASHGTIEVRPLWVM
jgi:hypothetical protein